MTKALRSPFILIMGFILLSLFFTELRYRKQVGNKVAMKGEKIRGRLLPEDYEFRPMYCKDIQDARNTIMEEYKKLDIKNASQFDPRVAEYIRKELIHPPTNQNYNLERKDLKHFSKNGQSELALKYITENKYDGFFVEARARDGETSSDTLFFEKVKNWSGILVEHNPMAFRSLLKKHRRAYSINAALSTTNRTGQITMDRSREAAWRNSKSDGPVTIPSLPLYSILRALDVETVDYLSLDIEGSEFQVLQTIPWDKVIFRLMSINFARVPEDPEILKEYLTDKGYEYHLTKDDDMWFGWPFLLRKAWPVPS